MLPGFARMRHIEVEKSMRQLEEYAETTPLNRVELSDTSPGYNNQRGGLSVCKRGFPGRIGFKTGHDESIAPQTYQDLCCTGGQLIIIEELEPVIEEQVKSWGIKVEGKELFTSSG